MNKLSIVTWLWRKQNKKTQKFNEQNVDELYFNFKNNYDYDFNFFCITDKKYKLNENIVQESFPEIFCDTNIYNKGCYKRIALFDSKYGLKFGERILQLDLDIVIVNNITSFLSIEDPLKIWQAPSIGPVKLVKNPTVMLFNVSHMQWFYNRFINEYDEMIKKAKEKYAGTDQALFSEFFNCPVWTHEDGIYSFRDYNEINNDKLPENAKIISFNSAKSWAEKDKLKLKWLKG